jgi:hypothetical protein
LNDDKVKFSILQGIAKAFGGLRPSLFRPRPATRNRHMGNYKFTDAYRAARRKKNRAARKSRRINWMRCK